MAEDPYAKITAQAFQATFDALINRPDCDLKPGRRVALMEAKIRFQNSRCMNKADAMQSLLAQYPEDTVPTMTAIVQQSTRGATGAPGDAPSSAPASTPTPPLANPSASATRGAAAAPGVIPPSALALVVHAAQSGNLNLASLTPALREQLHNALLQQKSLQQQQQQQQQQPQAGQLLPHQQQALLSASRPPAPVKLEPLKPGGPPTAAAAAAPATTSTAAALKPALGTGAIAAGATTPAVVAAGPSAAAAEAKAGPLKTAKAGGEDDVTGEGPEEADALATAGVSLAQEQEALMQGGAGRQTTRTMRDVMPRHMEEYVVNSTKLAQLMKRVSSRHGLASVDPTCLPYLAMAVEAHMSRLLTSMARCAVRRTDPARHVEGVQVPGLSSDAGQPDDSAQSGPMAIDQEAPAGQPDATNATTLPSSMAEDGPLNSQSLLTFRKTRPLLVKQPTGSPSSARSTGTAHVSLTRALGPVKALTTVQPAAGKPTGEQGTQVTLNLQDLVAALEKDTLLNKHPMLWKLHHQLK